MLAAVECDAAGHDNDNEYDDLFVRGRRNQRVSEGISDTG